MQIDYGKRATSASLRRAHALIAEAYRILAEEVGAANPADNQFLRESVICARMRLTWVGDRAGTDARSRDGEEVEIKTTRAGKSSLNFPTSRYVSQTVIDRFRAADYWLFGIFDEYEQMIALYRVPASGMTAEIDRLERELKRRKRARKALQNNPKIPLARIHGSATRVFLKRGYKEVTDSSGAVRSVSR